jgi:hypothetical protein
VLTASLLDRGELVHHRRCTACSGAVRLQCVFGDGCSQGKAGWVGNP